MRKRIIARLNELREKSGGFPKSTMRWCNLDVTVKGQVVHISEVNWKDFDDDSLLNVYERVCRRYFSQM